MASTRRSWFVAAEEEEEEEDVGIDDDGAVAMAMMGVTACEKAEVSLSFCRLQKSEC